MGEEGRKRVFTGEGRGGRECRMEYQCTTSDGLKQRMTFLIPSFEWWRILGCIILTCEIQYKDATRKTRPFWVTGRIDETELEIKSWTKLVLKSDMGPVSEDMWFGFEIQSWSMVKNWIWFLEKTIHQLLLTSFFLLSSNLYSLCWTWITCWYTTFYAVVWFRCCAKYRFWLTSTLHPL